MSKICRRLLSFSVIGFFVTGCAMKEFDKTKSIEIENSLFTLTPLKQNNENLAIWGTFAKLEEEPAAKDAASMAKYMKMGAWGSAGAGALFLGMYVADTDKNSNMVLGLLLLGGGFGLDYFSNKYAIQAAESHNSHLRPGRKHRSAISDFDFTLAYTGKSSMLGMQWTF